LKLGLELSIYFLQVKVDRGKIDKARKEVTGEKIRG
jgi:hypothetical protein